MERGSGVTVHRYHSEHFILKAIKSSGERLNQVLAMVADSHSLRKLEDSLDTELISEFLVPISIAEICIQKEVADVHDPPRTQNALYFANKPLCSLSIGMHVSSVNKRTASNEWSRKGRVCHQSGRVAGLDTGGGSGIVSACLLRNPPPRSDRNRVAKAPPGGAHNRIRSQSCGNGWWNFFAPAK